MNPTPTPAITMTGVRKSFGDKVVLDGIDLTVEEGTIFSLLGPNGAGKTTVVQILSTLIPADGGTLRVAGHDLAREPDAVRAAIGVTGQFSAVDNLLTMWQIIRELVADGVTIFLTTQYLDEADQLADRIAVLDHGRIVVEGTPEELKRRIPGGHIRLRFTDRDALESAARVVDATQR